MLSVWESRFSASCGVSGNDTRKKRSLSNPLKSIIFVRKASEIKKTEILFWLFYTF